MALGVILLLVILKIMFKALKIFILLAVVGLAALIVWLATQGVIPKFF